MQNTLNGLKALWNKETDWNGFLNHVNEDLKEQDWWDQDLLKSLEGPQAVFSSLAEQMEIENIKNPMFSLALLRLNSLTKVNVLQPEDGVQRMSVSIDDTTLARAGHFLRMSDLVYKLSPEEAGVMLRDVLLDNMNERSKGCRSGLPRHAVFYDHLTQTVVLAIRGTASLKDVITDTCAVPAPVMEGKGHGHEGISRACQAVLDVAVPVLAEALKQKPGYRVVITGHSLGAGIAIMAALWLRHGRWGAMAEQHALPADVIQDLTVYAFAPPPVFSPLESLTEMDTKNMYSFVHNIDVVPRCTLRTLEFTVNRMQKIDDVIKRVNNPSLVSKAIMTFDPLKEPADPQPSAAGEDGPDPVLKLMKDVEEAVCRADEEARKKTREDGKEWLHEQLYIPGRVLHLYPYAGEGEILAAAAFKTGKSISLAARYRMQEVAACDLALSPAIEGDSFVTDHQTLGYIKAFQRLDI